MAFQRHIHVNCQPSQLLTQTVLELQLKVTLSLKTTLVVLCRGIVTTNGSQILDLGKEPWKSVKASQVKPSNQDYLKEVLRRWDTFAKEKVNTRPCPLAWRVSQLQAWLDANPIDTPTDVAYLWTELDYYKKIHEERNKEKKINMGSGSKYWNTVHPYMQLIHALVDVNNNKEMFLKRYELSSNRLVVENRKSEGKSQTTVWELIADTWNNGDFSPTTEALPDLHSELRESITIGPDYVAELGAVTPEKVENKFATMMVAMKRGIRKWERSGQGEGGIDPKEPERDKGDHKFGSLNNCNCGALNCRHCFINASHILYLWHMLDKHDLLRSGLQSLDSEIAAADGGAGVPSVICPQSAVKSVSEGGRTFDDGNA